MTNSTNLRVDPHALKLAQKFINDADARGELKAWLVKLDLLLLADMIDEAFTVSRELIWLHEALRTGLVLAQVCRTPGPYIAPMVPWEQLPSGTKLYAAPAAAEPNFDGLCYLVQYRRKAGMDVWHNMAAFDVEPVADRYAAACGKDDLPWEYRVVYVAEETNDA